MTSELAFDRINKQKFTEKSTISAINIEEKKLNFSIKYRKEMGRDDEKGFDYCGL